MDVFERAIAFALSAHGGQRRKDGSDYIIHPMEAAVIAASITDDREVLAAAMLHDCVEDANIPKTVIEAEFGGRVAALVASETEDKRPGTPKSETWHIRKEESLRELENAADPGVKILWLSDKLANMRSFYDDYLKVGTALWERFNQKNTDEQYWYYSEVQRLTSELGETRAWREYSLLIGRVFEDNIRS